MADGQGLSEKQLQAAIWYVKHRAILRKAALGAIVAVDVALVAYSVFGAGRDLLLLPSRKKQEFELLRTAVAPAIVEGISRPQDLELGGVELLRVGRYTDVLARVRNPNPRWYARFGYEIGVGEKIRSVADGFLLPSEERPFFTTIETAGSGTVVFNIRKVSWLRINPKETPDFQSFREERLNFDIQEAKFIPEVTEGQSRTDLTIINRSAYGYVAPKFLVLLYRGSRLMGIQSVTVDQFKSGESRGVVVSWFDRLGAVSNIEVVPEIDILNSEVYMRPQ